jgi:hypothetical protein
MPPISGFLQALGGFFGGYGQDQQIQQQRARQQGLDVQAAQRMAMDQEGHAAQMQNYQSEVDARRTSSASTTNARSAATRSPKH